MNTLSSQCGQFRSMLSETLFIVFFEPPPHFKKTPCTYNLVFSQLSHSADFTSFDLAQREEEKSNLHILLTKSIPAQAHNTGRNSYALVVGPPRAHGLRASWMPFRVPIQ